MAAAAAGGGGGGGVLGEVELEDTKILWPGGVLYGGGETYENVNICVCIATICRA